MLFQRIVALHNHRNDMVLVSNNIEVQKLLYNSDQSTWQAPLARTSSPSSAYSAMQVCMNVHLPHLDESGLCQPIHTGIYHFHDRLQPRSQVLLSRAGYALRQKFSYWPHYDDYELDGLPDPGRAQFRYAKDKNSRFSKKRSQPARRSSIFDGRFVTTVHEQHSARELCANDRSCGPDFVSYSDNVYCVMGTKEH